MSHMREIEAALDEKVRPYLRSHGGEIAVERFEDGALYVRLLGQCAGCPAADLTAETIVEEELVKALPGIVRKVAVTQDISEELWEQAKRLLRNHQIESRVGLLAREREKANWGVTVEKLVQ